MPPDRDLYELARRFSAQIKQPVPRLAVPAPGPLRIGDRLDWKVSRASGIETVEAEVRLVSENAYWVFEENLDPDTGRLAQTAQHFERVIWPEVTGAFGNPWDPGVDGDPRIVIFHGILRPGVAGYFSGIDEYPVAIQPESNQREAIHISGNLLTLGGNGYRSTLAHELQHAVHWAADAGEESWVNEGLAEVASGLAGIPPGSVSAFTSRPNTSLVQWEPEIFQASPNYGAAALFFEYISAHYGGLDTLRAIIEHRADGLDSITAVLDELGYSRTAADVFVDWVVANLVDDNSGKFSHPERAVGTPRITEIEVPDSIQDSVRPFATNYYRVEDAGSEVTIEFEADSTGQVFPAQPHSGETCWWTNAGDSINTTLTRTVDLRSVDSATFMFWAWYAIEEDWDYAYVSVSDDGGDRWQIVPTTRSTFSDPNGTAFGPGITGESDGWVNDRVDLSRFTGSEILLRIEYITDDAIHDRGACFDDFSIPELGWADDTTDAADWTSAGFALINDRIPVEYALQVIYDTDDAEAEVTRISVGRDGRATATLRPPAADEQMVVAISAVTAEITGSPGYEIEFSSGQ